MICCCMALEPNMSTRRRCGLTLRYAAASVKAGMNWNEKGVVVRGSDPSGHWKNPQGQRSTRSTASIGTVLKPESSQASVA